jgi:lipoate-protein ligase B
MVHVEDLGLVDFENARGRQLERLESRVRGEAPDTLYLLEHPTVITLGRGTDPRNLKDTEGLPVIETERGGDVTLHAPGQVVGYLIRLLPEDQRDLHAHLRLLEHIVIDALAGFGISGARRDGATGVWVGEGKIASLGVACRNWCTWHGFALNVNIPLDLFEAINPCGFGADVMTSMARELGENVPMDDVKDALSSAVRAVLSPAR